MARTALVTGGTRGIGRAISARLKADGFNVAAGYSGNDDAARATADELDIMVVKGNVGKFEDCQRAVAEVEERFGPVEILVNNAGITRDGFFHKMTKENWNAVINTNLNSLFNMTRNVWEGMMARKFGRVIVISSVNGQKGQAGQANYSAAKAGDIGFVKALAQEGVRSGITVNAICPGYIGTEMVAAIPEEVLKSKILPLIPVGRLGKPEEIARCVAFLAADDSGFITGSTISANGGQYMI